jgi:hypothetical protein
MLLLINVRLYFFQVRLGINNHLFAISVRVLFLYERYLIFLLFLTITILIEKLDYAIANFITWFYSSHTSSFKSLNVWLYFHNNSEGFLS